MRHSSEGHSYLEMITGFYERFCKTNNAVVMTPRLQINQNLKDFLIKKLGATNEADAQFQLGEKTKCYYNSLNKKLQGKARVVRGRPEINVTNIFNPEDPTYPTRMVLLEIAFVLELKPSDCNEMLRIANQYDIHLGGDPQESIIYFCLEKGLSHLEAIRMYEQYCKNESLTEVSEEHKKTMSQRSQYIAKDLLKAIHIDCFDISKYEFENKLHLYSASYSYYSGRVRKFVLRLRDESLNKKEEPTDSEAAKKSALYSDFCVLFNRDVRGIDSELRKVYKGESHPSREFVYMLLCLDYYKNYEKISKVYSLEEHTNNYLRDFDMEELKDTRITESLLIELSKYKFQNRKKNMVQYNSDHWVILPSHNWNYVKQAGFIIKKYVDEINERYNVTIPIDQATLILKNSFLQDSFLKMPGDKREQEI